jgi:hypothetical protein
MKKQKRIGTGEGKPAPIWTRGAEDRPLLRHTTIAGMSTSLKQNFGLEGKNRSEFYLERGQRELFRERNCC